MSTVLIVDDEAATRTGLEHRVNWKGLGVDRVLTARNGMEGLEAARQALPDLVLSDIRMPKMDGLEMCRRLRSERPELKILFLSAYADKEYLKEALRVGTADYVEKPIDMPTLENAIRRALDDSRKLESDDETLRRIAENADPFVRKTAEFMKRTYLAGTTLAELAAHVGLSESYLCYRFKSLTGITVWTYLLKYRIAVSKTLLREEAIAIAEVADRSGFEDPKYFSRVFKRETGVTPMAFRKGGGA